MHERCLVGGRTRLTVTALLGLLVALLSTACGRAKPAPPARTLRVCADPNNMPFSNARGEGFENRIAQLVARDLHAVVDYTWWAERRGFVRNTLNAGACELVVGIPTSVDLLLTTRPYYRSTYVFVTRADRGIRLRSLDDPALARVKVGVQIIGNDHMSSPPAHALAARHIVSNVVGYSVFGDYGTPDPPAAIVRAVAKGEVDAAIAWGPMAGYFARRAGVPLSLQPVSPEIDPPFLPFVFDIGMGVRRGNTSLRDEVDAVIARRQAAIDRILDDYGVPRVGWSAGSPEAGAQ